MWITQYLVSFEDGIVIPTDRNYLETSERIVEKSLSGTFVTYNYIVQSDALPGPLIMSY